MSEIKTAKELTREEVIEEVGSKSLRNMVRVLFHGQSVRRQRHIAEHKKDFSILDLRRLELEQSEELIKLVRDMDALAAAPVPVASKKKRKKV